MSGLIERLRAYDPLATLEAADEIERLNEALIYERRLREAVRKDAERMLDALTFIKNEVSLTSSQYEVIRQAMRGEGGVMITTEQAIALAREVGAQYDTREDQLTALCNKVRTQTLLEAAEFHEQQYGHSWELRRMAGVE